MLYHTIELRTCRELLFVGFKPSLIYIILGVVDNPEHVSLSGAESS